MDDIIKNIKQFDCDNIPMTELRQRWVDFKQEFSYLAKTLSNNKKKRIKSLFLALALPTSTEDMGEFR